jgi:hypothetical protein
MTYEKHTLTLGNGATLSVGLNAMTYISDTRIDDTILNGGIGTVIDRTDETGKEKTIKNVYKFEQSKCDDGWQICIFTKSAGMLKAEAMQEQLKNLKAQSEEEKTLLKAQIKALSDRNDFLEDCVAEMASIVYA